MDAAARDLQWLYATLEPAAKADDFTARLLQMSRELHKEGLRQPMMLGIHRSDYMLHESGTPRFLQVELNTIASSMASHSANVRKLHNYVLGRYGSRSDDVGRSLQAHFGVPGTQIVDRLPANVALKEIPRALAKAHAAHGVKDAFVLFVVQDDERNFADQRFLEYALWEDHGVKVLRKSLTTLAREATLDAKGGLRVPEGEVSVVYYRAGYSPDDYPSESEWAARKVLEQSMAVKCPSVDYQLVGAKKVQQALARPGAVERFVGDAAGRRLRGSFAGLWGLGRGEDDAQIIKQACERPEEFVLKPQREGGGHNFYGADVAKKLKELTPEERSAYILMQRILPGLQPSVMTREGKVQVMDCLSEFGFYSVFLGDGRKVHLSEHAGHLVRTKAEGVDEGGVAAGYAVISGPFLT